MKPKMMIVDSSNILHNKNQARDTPNILLSFIKELSELVNKFSPNKIVLGNDVTKSRYREAITSTYKAHRKERKETPKQKKRTELMYKIRANLGNLFGEMLIYGNVHNLEFDDVCSLLCKDFSKEYDIIIISGDMDLLQLSEVTQYCPKKRDFLARPEELTPNQFLQYKMLVTDVSDGIKGVTGAGKKTTLKILKKYGSLKKALESYEYEDRWEKDALERMRSKEGKAEMKESYQLVKLFSDYKNMNNDEVEAYKKIKENIETFEYKPFHPTEEIKDLYEELEAYKAIWVAEMLSAEIAINQ